MNLLTLIEKKKLGLSLSGREIEWWISGVRNDLFADYQLSALLMSITCKGMNIREVICLTKSMLGQGITLAADGLTVIDKHSTGGIGDGVTFLLASILASLGFDIFKLSGKSLGITGGTIDKLQSITGFRTEISFQEATHLLQTNHLVIMSQEQFNSVDAKLYALRDVTGTANSIPLIAASIMSKKLIIPSKLIILDIKCGSGALLSTLIEAKALAHLCKKIANHFDRKLLIVISDMNAPLSKQLGNALEIFEIISLLTNYQPTRLTELSVMLSTLAIKELSPESSFEKIRASVIDTIVSGKALKHFQQFIVNQGGNWSQFTSLSAELKQSFIIYSEQTGYLIYSKLSNIGLALIELGAGRKLKTDFLDALSGIICHYEVYEKVAANTPLFTLFTKLDFTNLTQAIKLIKFAYRIVPNLDFKKNKLILEIM